MKDVPALESLVPAIHATGAAGCRWSMPTLFLKTPYWLEAETSPWACVRETEPRLLSTTDACAICSFWEPRAS